MRRRFGREFPKLLPEFRFFKPEFAMENYFASEDTEPFDIAEFESVVGQLSHSILIFPEGPGSFAETGYFSTIPELARKTLLVIDSSRQRTDSFISLGPAKKIGEASKFHPNVQMDYKNPDFSFISERLSGRERLNKRLKSLDITSFSKTSYFDLMCIIYKVCEVLSIATITDVEFILRAIFKGHISQPKTKQLVSVLVGAELLTEVGQFGHLTPVQSSESFLKLKEGYQSQQTEISLEIAALFPDSGRDFVIVLRAAGYDY